MSGSKSRQVGLDRVDVSHLAETAARFVDSSLQSRQERVATLSSHFRSGGYTVNLASLSQAILDHDMESDPAYVG